MTDPAIRPRPWQVGLALGLVYLCWGTTYLAIREGMKTMPPCLFGGLRITLGGIVVLAFLLISRQRVAVSGVDFVWAWLGGACFFVGGNGLINVAQKTVPSGVASVLVATTPLWMALLESAWPTGERLSPRGWAGLLLGLAGVVLLVSDRIDGTGGTGSLFVLGSAFTWAVGSFLLRRHSARASKLTMAAWQMLLGGASLTLLGVCLGEPGQLTPQDFTAGAVTAFFYLLVVGSLVGFVAFNWLLSHTTSALAGSYAYVNPVVAIVAGWLLVGEELTARILGGMAVILAGVVLVKTSTSAPSTTAADIDFDAAVRPAPVSNLLMMPGGVCVTEVGRVQK
jgi:drug/metabolite transporter (DMT)-like permease